jgi:photosystem II stability/assembly factor-like uncharacterized protein
MKHIILFACFIIVVVGGVFFGVWRDLEADLTGEWKILAQSELIHGSIISRVMFFDRNNGIVVSPGFIARSNDGGKRWTHVHSTEENGYYSFAFADARNGLAVGSVNNEVPLALRTTDAGRSWQTLNLDIDTQHLDKADVKITTFLDVCFDSTGTSWIVGSRGIVSAVVEENKLKVTSVHPTTDVLYSVACAENGRLWAVGQETVLSNGDGWQREKFDHKYYFGKVRSIGNQIWLLGGNKDGGDSGHMSAVLLRSNNSGGTWENRTPKSADLLHDMFRIDGVLWLIGARGQIYYSRDNGDSWMTFPSPTNADLLSIYFLDNRSGWITGDRGTVLAFRR